MGIARRGDEAERERFKLRQGDLEKWAAESQLPKQASDWGSPTLMRIPNTHCDPRKKPAKKPWSC